MQKGRRRQKFLTAIITLLLVVIFTGTFVYKDMDSVKASSTKEVDLRFIFTSDVHGQLNTKDYETGEDFVTGGLSKAYTLIEEAREETIKNNTFTFDVGDSLYNFTTEYIFAENQKEVQPIYKGLAKVGYDAITLGNHDLDYGYQYIINQLEGSGLKDITVVSNLLDSKTEEHPFKENMIITRNAVASDGSSVKVKVGIIGETLTTLSSKTENYTGVLKVEDIVQNVTNQAKKLREQGADVIVVLSHSGMGPENPELNYKNVSYALTKIDDVDVILCGHEHNMFPTTDYTSVYYNLPGVDKTTGLVNGKNLVMASDRGTSIGVVDLKLQKTGSSYSIINRSSDVRQTTKDTVENKTISSLYGTWEEELSNYSKKVIANVDENKTITNFFGLVQDNTSIQLLNDAKMAYALNYVNNINTAYKDYKIISASQYNQYGQNSYSDYVNLSGKITEADLASMQEYNHYIALYTITGKQLKEWLEWSASAYENTSNVPTWTGSAMETISQLSGAPSLVKSEWVDDWSNFTVFDGIEYVIDPSVEARYDKSGNKINNTNRITKLTYNGTNVTDAMVFLLSSDRITQTSEATKNLDNQYIVRGYNRSQTIVSEYLQFLYQNGKVEISPDYNWKIALNSTKQYIVKTSSLSESVASNYPWFIKKLDTVDQYNYYLGKGTYTFLDTTAPNIVAYPLTTVATNQDVKVSVKASDESGIKTLKYAIGSYTVNDNVWGTSLEITDNYFVARRNGTYSIYVEDKLGNKKVTKITINNINNTILEKPKVNTYTNRKTKITGTAEPLATIYFETTTKTYQSKVSSDGTFSYALPAQLGNSKLSVYVKDDSGRVSDKTTVKVKRTGPNQPKVNSFTNKLVKITGKTNDDTVNVYAIIGDTVYVSKSGGVTTYENREKYNEDLDVIETTVTIAKDGTYSIKVPVQLPGTKVSVYSVDHLNRVSRVNTVTTKDAAPNPPTIYNITNVERTVYGNVYNSTSKEIIYDIVVTIGDQEYTGVTDTDGNFAIEVGKLSVGDTIKVKAMDEVAGKTRTSYAATKKVIDISNYYDKTGDSFILDQVTNKSDVFTGQYENGLDTVFVSINKKIYELPTDEEGDFELVLPSRLSAGTYIYVYTRYIDGEMIEADRIQVKLAKPDTPYILNSRITNVTKTIKVITDKDSTVTVKVGDKKYTTTTYQYDSTLDAYVYSLVITKVNSGTEVKIYATNKAGTSKSYTTKVVKTAPNSPKVDEVYAGDKVITGKVNIVELTDPEKEQVTTVYAKIGKKTYKGTVDEEGNFTIKIKAQKKNTTITVWGENVSGRGPSKVIKVKAEKKK